MANSELAEALLYKELAGSGHVLSTQKRIVFWEERVGYLKSKLQFQNIFRNSLLKSQKRTCVWLCINDAILLLSFRLNSMTAV